MTFFLRPDEVDIKRDRWPIVRPGAGAGLEGWFIGEQVCFVNEHYVRGRTIPCSQQPECEGCVQGSFARLCAYCWMLDREDLTVKILALPKSGADQLTVLLDRRDSYLSGLKFFIKRAGTTKRSAVVVAINEDEAMPVVETPHVPRLEAVLLRLWGVVDPT